MNNTYEPLSLQKGGSKRAEATRKSCIHGFTNVEQVRVIVWAAEGERLHDLSKDLGFEKGRIQLGCSAVSLLERQSNRTPGTWAPAPLGAHVNLLGLCADNSHFHSLLLHPIRRGESLKSHRINTLILKQTSRPLTNAKECIWTLCVVRSGVHIHAVVPRLVP
jgi:hypothetical protein